MDQTFDTCSPSHVHCLTNQPWHGNNIQVVGSTVRSVWLSVPSVHTPTERLLRCQSWHWAASYPRDSTVRGWNRRWTSH